MHKQYRVALYRLSLGLLAFTAIITQYTVSLERPSFNPVNFFSFFTIASNVLAATIFTTAGTLSLLGIALPQRALLRGAATMYMTVTGIVYVLLLSGLEANLGMTLGWVNAVLHYVMPVAVLIDWLVSAPEKRLTFRAGLIWLAFPILYLAYSLLRGHSTGWYPYPFLDPTEHGYMYVALVCTAILLVALLLVWLLTSTTRLKGTPSSRSKKRA